MASTPVRPVIVPPPLSVSVIRVELASGSLGALYSNEPRGTKAALPTSE
jgi:hypothetical protein